ncbi:MAG: metallophosphoesterase [Limisphaerales bacterium]
MTRFLQWATKHKKRSGGFYTGFGFWVVIASLPLLFATNASAQTFNLTKSLPSLSSSQSSPAWSFVEISDLHAGSELNPQFSNTVSTIIANKDLWNVKLVISAGDLYEQYTNVGAYPWNNDTKFLMSGQSMTNQLWRFKTAGISVMAVPGNHDSDNTNEVNIIYWNDVFGTNFYASDPYWFSNRVANDTRTFALKFNVGDCKMLFIGLRWIDNYNPAEAVNLPSFANTNETIAAYAGDVAWASNLARQFPDYHVIPVMHYFMDTNGQPNYKDLTSSPDTPTSGPSANGQYVCEGPGLSLWNALKSAPNLMAVLSGHVRQISQVTSFLTCDDGHVIPSVKFNTQGGLVGNEPLVQANNGAVFQLFTVYPALKKVSVRNYGYIYVISQAAYTNRFLKNGELSAPTHNLSNDWSFTFK